jgi:hypothetical protein
MFCDRAAEVVLALALVFVSKSQMHHANCVAVRDQGNIIHIWHVLTGQGSEIVSRHVAFSFSQRPAVVRRIDVIANLVASPYQFNLKQVS